LSVAAVKKMAKKTVAAGKAKRANIDEKLKAKPTKAPAAPVVFAAPKAGPKAGPKA